MNTLKAAADADKHSYLKRSGIIITDRLLIALISVVPFVICLDYKAINNIIPLYKIEYDGRIICILILIFMIRELYSEDLILFFYVFSILFSTIINRRNFRAAINFHSSSMLITIFLIVIAGNTTERVLNVFETWKWLMLILLLIDLASFIVYPDGMYQEKSYTFTMTSWFLGYKTFRLLIYLPLSFICTYSSFTKKGRIDVFSYLILGLCIFGTIRCNASSATATLVFCLFCTALIDILHRENRCANKNIAKAVFNHKVWIPAFLVTSYLMCCIQWDELTDTLTDFFDRAYSISERQLAWERATELIYRKPLIGYGYLGITEFENYLGYRNAHNMFLTIALMGGLFALSIYIIYLFHSYKYASHEFEVTIISIYLYASFIVGVTSAVYFLSAFSLLPLYCLRLHRIESQSVKHDYIYIKN